MTECPKCGGKGYYDCPDCRGKGRIAAINGRVVRCNTCRKIGVILCDCGALRDFKAKIDDYELELIEYNERHKMYVGAQDYYASRLGRVRYGFKLGAWIVSFAFLLFLGALIYAKSMVGGGFTGSMRLDYDVLVRKIAIAVPFAAAVPFFLFTIAKRVLVPMIVAKPDISPPKEKPKDPRPNNWNGILEREMNLKLEKSARRKPRD